MSKRKSGANLNSKMYAIGMVTILYIVLIIGLVIFNSCGSTGGGLVTVELSCKIDGSVMTCPDGSTFDISQLRGQDGQSIIGERGQTGLPGKDGSSCSAMSTESGKFVVCTDGSSFQMFDGVRGEDGSPALVEVIDLCGNSYRLGEVLFRFSDGNLYGVYSDGNNKIHMVKIMDGSWISTDGYSCRFNVINGQITY
jgi:hypothetical protein